MISTPSESAVRPTTGLKSISVRKAGPVRLTSVAHPMYSSCSVQQSF